MLGIWKYVFFGDQTLCLLIAGAEICRIGVDTAQDTGASDGSVKLRTGIDLLQNLLQLMFNAFVFFCLKKKNKLVKKPEEHGLSFHFHNFLVQIIGIIFIDMFILFQIDAVLPVSHNDPYSAGCGKVDPELLGDFFDIAIINIIAKQKIVKIISHPFILHFIFQDDLSHTLGNIHKRSSFPPDVKQRKLQFICFVDHLLRDGLLVIGDRDPKAGNSKPIQFFHGFLCFFQVKPDIVHHTQGKIPLVHMLLKRPGLHHIGPCDRSCETFFPGDQFHSVQLQFQYILTGDHMHQLLIFAVFHTLASINRQNNI